MGEAPERQSHLPSMPAARAGEPATSPASKPTMPTCLIAGSSYSNSSMQNDRLAFLSSGSASMGLREVSRGCRSAIAQGVGRPTTNCETAGEDQWQEYETHRIHPLPQYFAHIRTLTLPSTFPQSGHSEPWWPTFGEVMGAGPPPEAGTMTDFHEPPGQRATRVWYVDPAQEA